MKFKIKNRYFILFFLAAICLLTVDAAKVAADGCGCHKNYVDPKTFNSYIWHESENRFIEVLVKDINGQAVFEGDVILGSTANMKALAKEINNYPSIATLTPESLSPRFAALITGHRNGSSPWKDNVVPYTFSKYLMQTGRSFRLNERLKSEVEESIKLWAAGTGLTFKDVTHENSSNNRRMIRFVKASGSTCSWNGSTAYVGRSCIRHEIGHALGLAHEHNRNGRDQFVTVNWKNIETEHCDQFYENKLPSRRSGAYDFSSIMHYRATEFNCNNKPSLTAVAPNRINRTNTISAGDFDAVRKWHGIPRQSSSILIFDTQLRQLALQFQN